MNPFLKGVFIGTAVGVLVAPMKGAELRQKVQNQFKSMSQSLSGNNQIQQFSQQATQTAQTLTQSVVNAVHTSSPGDTASPIEVIKQTASTVQQQAQNLTSSVRTAATEKLVAIKPLSTLLQSNQGLNPEIHAKLEAYGIHTTADLLERTGTQKQRAELALLLNTSASQLKSYAIQADLMRVDGINASTAQLLESAGVTGCQDFQKRNPEHLHNHLEELQAAAPSRQKVPSIEQLSKQIASAQEL